MLLNAYTLKSVVNTRFAPL